VNKQRKYENIFTIKNINNLNGKQIIIIMILSEKDEKIIIGLLLVNVICNIGTLYCNYKVYSKYSTILKKLKRENFSF
jgi:hypothetical protein